MIAKAAVLIQQLDNLITEIESLEDRELNELRGQLNAVHKAISTLNMSGLPIPQGLIETQQKLQSEITNHDDMAVVLAYLASELKNILDRTRKAESARRPAQGVSTRAVRTGTCNKGGSFVSRDILKRTLIEVLQTLGGSASKKYVEDEMEKRLQGVLTDIDYEPVGDGTERWRKNTEWVRLHLVHEGIMKANSPRGIWELK
jgi:hypothetical protein